MNENVTHLEFEKNNNEEYEIKGIWNNTVYAKILEIDHLPRFYYLVLRKATQRKKIFGILL